MKITRALISVSDKTGIAAFARALERQGVDIISTGGTADLLRKEKIPVRDISSFTAFPEVLEGRVKTLHPRVHGGLLYKRGNEKHETEARECGFEPIDLVVVNLYPFEATIAKPDVTLGGSDREHRHRRPVDDSQRGKKLRISHRGGRSGRLRRGAGKHAR